jgi:hypothetical protein
LVEDCELSFRVLFAGFRTTFARVLVPGELPASVTAYKAQQKRWTLGWAQLLRIHLGELLFRHECAPIKRLHLLYHMAISVQWPAWLAWYLTLPHVILSTALSQPLHTGSHTAAQTWTHAPPGSDASALAGSNAPFFVPLPGSMWPGSYELLYAAVPLLMLLASAIAAFELRHTYASRLGWSAPACAVLLLVRALPSGLLSLAMLPHQATAWFEGLVSTSAEFETTPKHGAAPQTARPAAHPALEPPTATPAGAMSKASPLLHSHLDGQNPAGLESGSEIPPRSFQRARIPMAYIAAEGLYVVYQLAMCTLLARAGLYQAAAANAISPILVSWLCIFYGDDA